MRLLVPSLLALPLLTLLPPGAAAQMEDGPRFLPEEPGTRVRVTVPAISRTPIVGTVVQMDDETLTLSEEKNVDARLTVPLEGIQRLEARIGERSAGGARARGARIGALIVFGAAFVGGALYDLGDQEGGFRSEADDYYSAMRAGAGKGLIAAPVGALLGWGLGSGSREIFQNRTPPPAPLVIAPAAGGGSRVSLTLRTR